MCCVFVCGRCAAGIDRTTKAYYTEYIKVFHVSACLLSGLPVIVYYRPRPFRGRCMSAMLHAFDDISYTCLENHHDQTRTLTDKECVV